MGSTYVQESTEFIRGFWILGIRIIYAVVNHMECRNQTRSSAKTVSTLSAEPSLQSHLMTFKFPCRIFMHQSSILLSLASTNTFVQRATPCGVIVKLSFLGIIDFIKMLDVQITMVLTLPLLIPINGA